jgi:hypothetical protein
MAMIIAWYPLLISVLEIAYIKRNTYHIMGVSFLHASADYTSNPVCLCVGYIFIFISF